MNAVSSYQVTDPGQVSTLHILQSGEIVSSVEDYMKVQERFLWVDKTYIISKILQLRKLTEHRKKSVIAIYEEGKKIREFINVDEAFSPLAFW